MQSSLAVSQNGSDQDDLRRRQLRQHFATTISVYRARIASVREVSRKRSIVRLGWRRTSVVSSHSGGRHAAMLESDSVPVSAAKASR